MLKPSLQNFQLIFMFWAFFRDFIFLYQSESIFIYIHSMSLKDRNTINHDHLIITCGKVSLLGNNMFEHNLNIFCIVVINTNIIILLAFIICYTTLSSLTTNTPFPFSSKLLFCYAWLLKFDLHFVTCMQHVP
jgi:hypothetical protein